MNTNKNSAPYAYIISFQFPKDVLDVGTGNGYYLDKLYHYFPGKAYCGIDSSQELIHTAKQKIDAEKIHFEAQDFFSLNQSYDFVITRLLWQHLDADQVQKGLSKLIEITRPGGSVLIMDAMDEARFFSPELPLFNEVIAAYKAKKFKTEKRDRDIIDRIHGWALNEDSWTVGLNLPIMISSTISGNMDFFHQIYGLWLDLFDAAKELDMDFAPVRAELESWCQTSDTYAQVGMRILRLDLST